MVSSWYSSCFLMSSICLFMCSSWFLMSSASRTSWDFSVDLILPKSLSSAFSWSPNHFGFFSLIFFTVAEATCSAVGLVIVLRYFRENNLDHCFYSSSRSSQKECHDSSSSKILRVYRHSSDSNKESRKESNSYWNQLWLPFLMLAIFLDCYLGGGFHINYLYR